MNDTIIQRFIDAYINPNVNNDFKFVFKELGINYKPNVTNTSMDPYTVTMLYTVTGDNNLITPISKTTADIIPLKAAYETAKAAYDTAKANKTNNIAKAAYKTAKEAYTDAIHAYTYIIENNNSVYTVKITKYSNNNNIGFGSAGIFNFKTNQPLRWKNGNTLIPNIQSIGFSDMMISTRDVNLTTQSNIVEYNNNTPNRMLTGLETLFGLSPNNELKMIHKTYKSKIPNNVIEYETHYNMDNGTDNNRAIVPMINKVATNIDVFNQLPTWIPDTFINTSNRTLNLGNINDNVTGGSRLFNYQPPRHQHIPPRKHTTNKRQRGKRSNKSQKTNTTNRRGRKK